MRISELAERVGVPTSTVRYYERIGLLGRPARTGSGYRDYGEDSATLLLFVHRARKMGLSCEQVAELLPVWGGVDCLATQVRVRGLIDDKQAEIARRIVELREFAAALDQVRVTLEASPPPAACRTDLSCCLPSGPVVVPIELGKPSTRAGRRRAFVRPGRASVESV
ncbi:MAG TPA: MerR family transcriptional regulator [Nakamurella sp.]